MPVVLIVPEFWFFNGTDENWWLVFHTEVHENWISVERSEGDVIFKVTTTGQTAVWSWRKWSKNMCYYWLLHFYMFWDISYKLKHKLLKSKASVKLLASSLWTELRGKDDRRLFTAPCGTRAKWPSERRNPLYDTRVFQLMSGSCRKRYK